MNWRPDNVLPQRNVRRAPPAHFWMGDQPVQGNGDFGGKRRHGGRSLYSMTSVSYSPNSFFTREHVYISFSCQKISKKQLLFMHGELTDALCICLPSAFGLRTWR